MVLQLLTSCESKEGGFMETQFSGTIYSNGRRYWWKVKFPGDSDFRQIPLKPEGAKFATTDLAMAQEIAAELWQKAIFKPELKPVDFTGTVASLCQLYIERCKTYYRKKDGTPTGETENVKYALKPLLKHYGILSVADFGPLRLEELRGRLIASGLSRGVINQRVNVIRRMYKWAVSRQIVSAMTHHALMSVEALEKYRSDAYEPEDIKPAAEKDVFALLPFGTKTLAAMIQVQYHTAMRSGELIIMRPGDIDRSEEIWKYIPGGHKREHAGQARVISIGPKAQEVLAPFLLRDPEAYCFSPADSCRQSQIACHDTTKIRSGLNDRYSTHTYANAIKQMFKKAKEAGVEIPNWHPHQLRHTAATNVRKKCGRDAARATLGHKTSRITDTYAEIDEQLSVDAAKKIG